ncbi:MAG: hypothetical protein KGL51_03320 [Betaproteobacteria bacterium]|nr:hypothetical protein [Betaproteobacteria bacterium]MDE2122263.1 hypothetical protein [Betaproteobacteria bacterium]MDE2185966.1 hypothetical protein [Betaproteobacteria bacterium]MDE2323688.1 hypothetical protein [Betaproteobacteria bacterium]
MKAAHLIIACSALGLGTAAWAKLPPPSPEAKAKAEEAAAKAKWGDKVAAYQLCQAQNRVAAYYEAHAKQQGESIQPPVPTPACVDPGPFAYTAPEVTPAPTADKK